MGKFSRAGELCGKAGRLLADEGPSGILQKALHWHRYRQRQPKIDAEYGTETLAWVEVTDISASGPNVAHAIMYGPSPVLDVEVLLKQLPICFGEFDFVDLGCGKGLVLMLATQFGFRRVVGVEFGRNLYEVALANLNKFRARNVAAASIEIHLDDAARFPLPERPLVIYLYNPFGAEVVSQVIANLEASLAATPRECWVVYVNPVHHELFEACPLLKTQVSAANSDKGEPHCVFRYMPG